MTMQIINHIIDVILILLEFLYNKYNDILMVALKNNILKNRFIISLIIVLLDIFIVYIIFTIII